MRIMYIDIYICIESTRITGQALPDFTRDAADKLLGPDDRDDWSEAGLQQALDCLRPAAARVPSGTLNRPRPFVSLGEFSASVHAGFRRGRAAKRCEDHTPPRRR